MFNGDSALIQLAVSNVFIGTTYLIAAFWVVPKFRGMSFVTKIWGFLFLTLCGIFNHFELTIHLIIFEGDIPRSEMLDAHMVIGHAIQAIAAVGFVGGTGRDIKRGKDPFSFGERRKKDVPVSVDRRHK